MSIRGKRPDRLGDKVLISRIGGPRKLIEAQGMTKHDWERVYFAYLAFTTQVRCIVADVEARRQAELDLPDGEK